MSHHRLRDFATLSLLLLAAGASHALGIGRPQGATVLGRPLELQVPVSLDPGMSAGDLCPEAEVTYGDLRVSPRHLDLQALPAGDGQALLRLRVAAPLEEPYASVQVRVGCAQRLVRRFVLLVEDPAAGGEPPPAPVTVAVSSAPATTFAPAAPVATGSPGAPAGAASGGPTTAAVAAGTSATPTPGASTPAPALRRAAARPPVAPARPLEGRPRLRLDPPESAPAAAPGTAASRVAAPPAAASARGADTAPAAAPGPDEAARMLALEGEVKTLQQALRGSQAQASALAAQLAQAEQDRYSHPLAWILAVTTVLALGGMVVLARRRPSQPPAWWLGAGIPELRVPPSAQPAAEGLAGDLSLDVPEQAVPSKVVGGSRPASPGAPAAMSPATPLRGPAGVAAGAPGQSTWRADGASLPGVGLPPEAPALLSSNELSDVRQEADFFLSLGEDERAIEVLRNHLQSQPQASAMPWFDLLEIYHRMGRKADYEEIRRDFEWRYEARVPSFDHYETDPAGLDAHPDILSRIAAAWPTPEVLKVIDEAIFRPPAGSRGKPLSVAAYRDLLLLHQILRDLSEGSTSAPLAMATPSRLSALAVPPMPKAPTTPVPAPATRPGARVLDIDLDRVLGQASAAREPGLGAIDLHPRHVKGMDELLDFKLDTRSADKPRSGGGAA